MFSKLSQKKSLILIIVVSILSLWQILRLYFSYEDLAFFYTFLFPEESASIITSSGISKHHAVYRFIYPLFKLLGYKPFGYYLSAVLLFVIYNLFYFLFLKKIYPRNSKLALYATLIQASLYIGIDGFIWNMTVGPEILLFLIFSIFVFFGLINFIKKRKLVELLIFVSLYIFTVYFFPFRSYFLFGWLPFYVFCLAPKEKKFKLALYLISFLLLIAGVGLLWWILVKFGNSVLFVDLNARYLLKTFLKDISYLFPFYNLIIRLPTKIILPPLQEFIIILKGFVILLFITLVPFFFKKRKDGLSRIIWFFSFSFLSSLLMMMAATHFTGQVALVWETGHWYYLTMLPVVAGTIAAVAFAFEEKFKNLKVDYLIAAIVVINIFLTNKAIAFRIETHSNPLRYFYESIKKEIPTLSNKNLVIFNMLGSPRALNPFVSGIAHDGIINLAGYYNLSLKDLNYTFSPRDGVDLIIEKNLDIDDVYSLDYIKDDLRNDSDIFREVIKSGRKVMLGKNLFGKTIELDNLKLGTTTPLYLKIKAKIIKGNWQGKVIDDDFRDYLNIFFNQNQKRQLYKISVNGSDNSPQQRAQNIIDGNYDTSWILKDWVKGGCEIIVDLGQVLNMNKTVWATSRNSPWFLRSISEYQVLSSLDNKEYKLIKNVKAAEFLDRGEFFVDVFPAVKTRFVKIKILKTHGGWTPAIDEIDVFEQSEKVDDFNKYFEIKNDILDYLPSKTYLDKYLTEILGYKIPVKILWKNEYNASFGSDNVWEFQIDVRGEEQTYNILIPKTGREINAIKLEAERFPSQLLIRSIEAWYPSIDDFRYDNIFQVK